MLSLKLTLLKLHVLFLMKLNPHVLVFEFQVGDLKNNWLIDSGCSTHMTGEKGLKSRPGGDKEVHHLWEQWARACAIRR
jgi:hypothetical protein